MLKAWMVWRYLHDGRRYFSLTFVLSVLGIALGVASLVIAMAVVSGYESTLRETVINMQGHLMVLRRGGVESGRAELETRLQDLLPELRAITPFAVVEGMIVHNKTLSGVVLEGVDPGTVGMVLPLERSLSEGEMVFSSGEKNSADLPHAIIGKGIAKKFSLKVGDEFKLVIPVGPSGGDQRLRPKAQRFRAVGVLDLGRTDYDERYILTDLTTAQRFGELGDRISGWRLRLSHYQLADEAAKTIESEMGFPFWVRSWRDANKNLFQAVQYERAVIFFIVSIMIVAAAFNVSSTLFLSVVRRYSQISILKAMGVTSKFVRQLFTFQGLFIGMAGAVLGLLLGWCGCQTFLWAEKKWGLFPGEVYKLDFVELEIRVFDLVSILSVTLLICYISTLAPARRGARLLPVEGLRYE